MKPIRNAVKILIKDSQKDLALSKSCIKDLIYFLVEQKKIETDQINIYFVSKKKISEMHQDFFEDPSPTDCISFPIDEATPYRKGNILGELFVCPAVAKEYAEKHDIDPKEELLLYLVHGFLHLLGYDDQTIKDRKIMQTEQNRLLRAFLRSQ